MDAEILPVTALFMATGVVLLALWASGMWGAGPWAALRRDLFAGEGLELLSRLFALGTAAAGLLSVGLVGFFVGFSVAPASAKTVVALVTVPLLLVGFVGVLWSLLWFLPIRPCCSVRPPVRTLRSGSPTVPGGGSAASGPLCGWAVLRCWRPQGGWCWHAPRCGRSGVALIVLALASLVPTLGGLLRGTWLRVDDAGLEAMTGSVPVHVPWGEVTEIRAAGSGVAVRLRDAGALTASWTTWQRWTHPVRQECLVISVLPLRVTPMRLAGLLEEERTRRAFARRREGSQAW